MPRFNKRKNIIKPRVKNVIIMPRDIELFKYLYKRKVLEVQGVQKKIFSDSGLAVTRRRLKVLSEAGYLQSYFHSNEGRIRRVYSLTKKSFVNFIKNDYSNYKFTKLRSEAIQHDLKLGEILEAAEKLDRILEIKTENELCDNYCEFEGYDYSKFRNLRADSIARLKYENEDMLVQFEYERSPKSVRRYLELFEKSFIEDIDSIVYFCENETIKKTIFRAIKKRSDRYDERILCCTDFSFLKDQKVISLEFLDGKKVPLV